ncbi:MAG: hypothetical protein LH645_06925 [Actinomycetia bacterium]|nr:hypothetical protein [Actinomycetes bacterium]
MPSPVLLVDDGTFEVVAESFDPASSDVAVLSEAEQAGADLSRSLLLRHAVEVPIAASSLAREQLAADGYVVGERISDSASESVADASSASRGMLQLRADRTVRATGLVVAQERARVAGLAARLGGDVHGWQLLAPPPGDRDHAGYDRGDR